MTAHYVFHAAGSALVIFAIACMTHKGTSDNMKCFWFCVAGVTLNLLTR